MSDLARGLAVAMSSLSFSLAPSLVRQQQLLGFSLGLATGAALFLHHKLLLWRLSADSAAALSHQPPPARESYQVKRDIVVLFADIAQLRQNVEVP